MSKKQTCMQLVFLLSISPLLFSAQAIAGFTHTLKQGDTLKYGQFIYSPNYEYYLSFFTSGVTQKNYYLGIYRASVRVWVANRDTPILDDSVFLIIDSNGTFAITRSGGNPIVLYSDDGEASNSSRVATLHDNGNLVLSELHFNGSKKILWQSFDHPTDILLPGMLLGTVYNKKVPSVLSLTSWLATSDPTSGAFTLDWDPMEQKMAVRRRGVIVWKSGVLKDGIFQYMPEILGAFTKVLIRADGNSFYFSSNKTAFWKLSEQGSLKFQIDDSTADESFVSDLRIMDMCYGYNNDNGCVKWLQPKCRKDMPTFTLQLGFFRRIDNNETDSGVRYANASIGPGDCRAICWEDCDCVAYDDQANDDDTGCLFWNGKTQSKFIHDNTLSSIYVISKAAVSSSPTKPPQPSNEGPVQRQNSSARPRRKLETSIAMMLSALLVCNVLLIYKRVWE